MTVNDSCEYLVNYQIKRDIIQLIDENNKNCGIVKLQDAIRTAQERSLDVVAVSLQNKIPVCKLMNFGKFKYELSKKDNKPNKNRVKLKEIKLRAVTDINDQETKKKKIAEFLGKKFQVKIVMEFFGREIKYKDKGLKIFEEFINTLPEHKVISKLQLEEKKYSILIGSL